MIGIYSGDGSTLTSLATHDHATLLDIIGLAIKCVTAFCLLRIMRALETIAGLD